MARARKHPKIETQDSTGGRPSLLTKERQKAICDAVALGTEYTDASLLNGVEKPTLHGWLRTARLVQGKERSEMSYHQRDCVDFTYAVREAQAKWRQVGERRIEVAATIGRTVTKVQVTTKDGVETRTETTSQVVPDWRAQAWMLERKFPELYAERRELEVSGPGGAPVEIALPDVMEKIRTLRERRDATEAISDPELLTPEVSETGTLLTPSEAPPESEIVGSDH